MTPFRRLMAVAPGIRYMAVAAFFFSIMSLLVKVAGARIPSQEVVLARSVVVTGGALVLLRRKGLSPWGTRRGLLVLRSLLGFTALSCFFFALTRLPLADATVIHHMNPVFTAMLAALVLGERFSARAAAFVAMSFIGVALVARPGFLFGGLAASLDPVAVGVAVMGAVLSAGAYVAVRRLGATEHPLVIILYFGTFSLLGSIPIVAPMAVLPVGVEWLVLLGVGLATLLAQIALTHGLALELAGRATAVGYLQIVFAALWGAIFFAEIPGAWGLAGALLIVGGTLGIARTRGRVGGLPGDTGAMASGPSVPP